MSSTINVKVGDEVVTEVVGLSSGEVLISTVTADHGRFFEVSRWPGARFDKKTGKTSSWRYYHVRRAKPHELTKLRQKKMDDDSRRGIIKFVSEAGSKDLRKISSLLEDLGYVE